MRGHGVPIFATFLAILLLLPVLIVAYLSFSASSYFVFPVPSYSLRNYQPHISDPQWMRATFSCIRVALMAAGIATMLGGYACIWLVARWHTPSQTIIALVLSPTIMPTIVVAVATYFVLARVGLQGTEFGLALGHAVFAIPFVVVIVVANLRGLNPAYERAARSLGLWPPSAPLRRRWSCRRSWSLPSSHS